MSEKQERLVAAIAGERADRAPVALWRHFPVDDQDPAALAQSCLQFQAQFDFDFVKVTPASSYCLRDWGVQDRWEGSHEGTRAYTRRVIEQPSHWEQLPVLDPEQGSLGEHLQALSFIADGMEAGTPFVATIFSPLAQAKNLAGAQRLREHLIDYQDELRAGLDVILKSTISFIEAAKRRGIAGIFYAVQHASRDWFDWESYGRFGVPYDRAILDAAGELWLNILHLHGEGLMFRLADELDPPVVNWHDRETAPGLRAGKARVSGAVCGGVGRWDPLVLGTPEQVRDQACEAIRSIEGGLILGTGCVLPITAPRSNIRAFRECVNCA